MPNQDACPIVIRAAIRQAAGVNRPHWQYFLSLVDDVDRLSRFVDLSESNFGTHSVECTRILLAAASEVDVVAKVLCERCEPGSAPRSIVECGQILLAAHPGLTAVEVSIPRSGLDFVPWKDWTLTARPDWWTQYNDVKHERHNYASEGNLRNALNAVAGLCVLVSYLDYDYVSRLNVHKPFFFISPRYKAQGKPLFASGTALPDFADPPATPDPPKTAS